MVHPCCCKWHYFSLLHVNITHTQSSLSICKWTFRVPPCVSQRRQWHSTPVLLPGKSHGWRSLVGCSGVAKSQTRLSDFTFTFHFHALEKEMATHSSILALENPRDGGAQRAAVYGVAESDMTEAT